MYQQYSNQKYIFKRWNISETWIKNGIPMQKLVFKWWVLKLFDRSVNHYGCMILTHSKNLCTKLRLIKQMFKYWHTKRTNCYSQADVQRISCLFAIVSFFMSTKWNWIICNWKEATRFWCHLFVKHVFVLVGWAMEYFAVEIKTFT